MTLYFDKELRDQQMGKLRDFFTRAYSSGWIDDRIHFPDGLRDSSLSISVIEFNVDGKGGVLVKEDTVIRENDKKAEFNREYKIIPISQLEGFLRSQDVWVYGV